MLSCPVQSEKPSKLCTRLNGLMIKYLTVYDELTEVKYFRK